MGKQAGQCDGRGEGGWALLLNTEQRIRDATACQDPKIPFSVPDSIKMQKVSLGMFRGRPPPLKNSHCHFSQIFDF